MAPPRSLVRPLAWTRSQHRHVPRELRAWFQLAQSWRVEQLGPWDCPHAMVAEPVAGSLDTLRSQPHAWLAFLCGAQWLGERHADATSGLWYSNVTLWPGCGVLWEWSFDNPLSPRPMAPSLHHYLALSSRFGADNATHHTLATASFDTPPWLDPERLVRRSLTLMLCLAGVPLPAALAAVTVEDPDPEERAHLGRWPHIAVFWLLWHGMHATAPVLKKTLDATSALRHHPTVRDARTLASKGLAARVLDQENTMARKGAKSRALELTISAIEKQFGRGILTQLDELDASYLRFVSTGLPSLDHALGCGGYPQGRIIDIYGPEASGKTTLALHALAAMQREEPDKTCLYIDADATLNRDYAETLGIDPTRLQILQPSHAEQALEVADMMVRSNMCSMVVIDSVAALSHRAELEGEMGDSHLGLLPKLMGQAMRKLTNNLRMSKTTLVLVNQLRMKIGVMFGSPENSTGGLAIKHHASVRLDMRRIGAIKLNKSERIGNRCRIRVVKNVFGSPFRDAELDLMFGRGFDFEGQLLDLGMELKQVHKSGAWYYYHDTRLGQGREQAKEWLRAHPDMAAQLEMQLRE